MFVLSKILWTVLRPSTLLLVALPWLGLILLWLRRPRLGMTLLTLGLTAGLAVLVLPINHWLLLPLEDRFPRPAWPDHVDGIIVLGGAIQPFVSAERGIASLNDAAERITEMVALARRYPQARLAFTGGIGDVMPTDTAEADFVRPLIDSLGLADRPLISERRSRNTWENALYLHEMADPKPGEIWLLVTSASHMPRSVGIFRRVGWPIIPWPVGYKSGRSAAVQYTTQFGEKIIAIDWASHEWVGLVAYRLLGRTSALFPAPEPPPG